MNTACVLGGTNQRDGVNCVRTRLKMQFLSVIQLWASHLLYIEIYLCSLYNKYKVRQFASNHLLRETFEWVLHLFSIAN